MYIYHALINALGAHVIHLNLTAIFYIHVERSPTKTSIIKNIKNIKCLNKNYKSKILSSNASLVL